MEVVIDDLTELTRLDSFSLCSSDEVYYKTESIAAIITAKLDDLNKTNIVLCYPVSGQYSEALPL